MDREGIKFALQKHFRYDNSNNNDDNNNRELIERFRKLKALYNFRRKKGANTHNYTGQWYISIQNMKINKHFHTKHGKNTHTQDHTQKS